MTEVTLIDYEAVVGELHARIGTRVLVGVGTIDGGYSACTLLGSLSHATDVDASAVFPSLLSDRVGESLVFLVGDPGGTVSGTFVLFRPGFQWGRKWQAVLGLSVSFAVEGIAVRVMPAPPLLRNDS